MGMFDKLDDFVGHFINFENQVTGTNIMAPKKLKLANHKKGCFNNIYPCKGYHSGKKGNFLQTAIIEKGVNLRGLGLSAVPHSLNI